jgi:hypothetical protein
MQEYHFNCHPEFMNYVQENYKQHGGNLSVGRDTNRCPLTMIGQDETVFTQFSFASNAWYGANGESVLLPKSSRECIMYSAFSSLSFGLGCTLTLEEMDQIK